MTLSKLLIPVGVPTVLLIGSVLVWHPWNLVDEPPQAHPMRCVFMTVRGGDYACERWGREPGFRRRGTAQVGP